MWGTHLGQNFIKPLQRSVQVDLYPAGGARDILAVVFRTPALWEKRHIVYAKHDVFRKDIISARGAKKI